MFVSNLMPARITKDFPEKTLTITNLDPTSKKCWTIWWKKSVLFLEPRYLNKNACTLQICTEYKVIEECPKWSTLYRHLHFGVTLCLIGDTLKLKDTPFLNLLKKSSIGPWDSWMIPMIQNWFLSWNGVLPA